jgi:hypothetical protein
VAVRPPKGLPDGEYRAHMLFRAIPPAKPVTAKSAEGAKGLSFQLTPVYGVTIPVIVRLGNLDVEAGISNVRLEQKDGRNVVALDVSRSGERSTFGDVRVFKPGIEEPIAIQRAVAVYDEIGRRQLAIPVSESFAGDVRGPVTVEYVETFDDGSRTIAETQAVLR